MLNSTDQFEQPPDSALSIARQGGFFAGGRAIERDGDIVRGDHLYVQFQVPANARGLPLIFWHGGTTSGAGWECTPDGRESFQSLLVRRGFSTYVIDQPRKGRSGGAPFEVNLNLRPPGEIDSWNIWRLGEWNPPDAPTFFPGVQVDRHPNSIDQLFRQRTPEIGPSVNEQVDVALDALDSLIERTGRCVLIIHSNSGKAAWQSSMRNEGVAGIVAYEPGAFVFPDDQPPEEIYTTNDRVRLITQPILVPREQFDHLAKIPIQLVYGDNITGTPSANLGAELWRVNMIRAGQFSDTLNQIQGSAAILHLPAVGLRGNTHFAFSDLNNVDIADLLVTFLRESDLA